MDAGRPQAHGRDREARRDPGRVKEQAILTCIDHVTIGVPDLEAGVAAYARLGFEIRQDGDRAVALNEVDFLELREHGREGLLDIALRSDAPAADAAAVRSRGPAGFVSIVGAPPARAPGRHPNGVLRMERVYIAVEDVAVAAAAYGRALGLPVPTLERGTVINAEMAAFKIGAAALTLAQANAPGVTADAMARRGPGPFQVLYRTGSMDAAARWMAEHGVPPPVRGIRNTGEQAMVVPPQFACGACIGFVGPA
jgi:catechol 2,3-dioxygenase-like lactoylglutathione lyase family enzyme